MPKQNLLKHKIYLNVNSLLVYIKDNNYSKENYIINYLILSNNSNNISNTSNMTQNTFYQNKKKFIDNLAE